jgi:demethylmenaquinone methyltransferase/2-methoxy-6-polyprenyl-1,4-benzoquinol methylase
MPRLRDLDLGRHLAEPGLKQRFVTPMFDLVAPRYDDFTRLFSYGMDRGWKRLATSELASYASGAARVLDLATGTGDLAFAAAAALARAQVTGVDASPRMVECARARAIRESVPHAGRPAFAVGDMARLAVADASVDAITAGYAFRNAPDRLAALREAARVLRPGGVMVTLDFYRPESTLWRALFLSYLRAAGSLVGWWWHRERVAYGYIAASIEAFVSAERFNEDLALAGFEVRRVHRFVLGGVAIHVALRAR